MNVWLVLHVIGVVLFIGNIVTAAFWKIRADLQKDPVVIHSTVKNVMLADYVFTLPGLVLILISGNAMAVRAGLYTQGMNWLWVSLILFGVAGIVWLAILVPMQRAMIRHSAGSVAKGGITDEYRRASKKWAFFGTVATLLPLVVLYLMIVKGF